MMLAVLPKRHLDEVSGELLVAAYRESLAHYSAEAINFLRKRSIDECKWFPTVAECHEILAKWWRVDEFTKRRSLATEIRLRQITKQTPQETQQAWRPQPGELERIKAEAAEAVKARG